MPGDYPREGHGTLLNSQPRKQGYRKSLAKCEVVRLRSRAAQHAAGPTSEQNQTSKEWARRVESGGAQ
eukprot:364581-Chlamydomonas_euryale.AAC.7